MIHNEKEFRYLARVPIETFVKSIHDSKQHGMDLRGGDRGERAILRRVSDPISALTSHNIHLIEKLTGELKLVYADSNGLALAATLGALLASLKGTFNWGKPEQDDAKQETQRVTLGSLAGRAASGGNSACLSRLRFGMLTKAYEPEKRLKSFRQLLQITKSEGFEKVDPVSLAYLYLSWDSSITRWTFARDYFMAGKTEVDVIEDDPDQDASALVHSA